MRTLLAVTTFILSLGTGNSHSPSDDLSSEEHAKRLVALQEKWGTDWAFSGISTFAHLPHVKCLTDPDTLFDIGVIGVPFDTTVSYRPGARFGPRAIRAGSARQVPYRAYNPRAKINPYSSWAKIVDCGDIAASPFDNALAIHQMSEAYDELSQRKPPSASQQALAPYLHKPKLFTLGGDHSIMLPALRALRKAYNQPIAVVHFDAHLDTWHPAKYPSAWLESPTADGAFPQSYFNHGSMLWIAGRESLVANGSSVHAGLRSRLAGHEDLDDDALQGYAQISADDIDDLGPRGVAEAIVARVGTELPVYLSVDIDVIDPGLAPGTGTPEPGGWTTRELIRVLRGLEGLNVVGADVVEVSPVFDGAGEATALAAAQVAYEILTNMVLRGFVDSEKAGGKRNGGVKDEL